MQAPPINGTMVDMIIAIDTGGTKTLIAKFSDDGELVSVRNFPPQGIKLNTYPR